MLRRLTVLFLLAVLLAPAAAAAQQNPLGPLPAPVPEQPPPVTPTSQDPDDDGLERWQQLAIFGGGIVLIGGIAFGILHDARRRAPVEEDRGHASSVHDTPATKRKTEHRKKTKAQRAARKRQRSSR